MATFNFPYHTYSVDYPENSTAVRFGRGYRFVSRPEGPPERIFKLKFNGMKWYFVGSTTTIDRTSNPLLNIATLEDFYKEHELWKVFVYPHPTEGNKNVRFSTPLRIPEVTGQGFGVVEGLEIQLIEVP